MVAVQCTDYFLKASQYGSVLNLVVHGIFDEPYDGSYENSLSHNTVNGGVYDHGEISEAGQPYLQIEFLMYTLYHSRYQDINKPLSLLKVRFLREATGPVTNCM